jgi:hypothetical protein
MTDTPIPDWVLIEAAKRFAWDNAAASELRRHYQDDNYIGYTALCDMILKHEQRPVDRKLLCAREAYREWLHTNGSMEERCVRAIELYEEGFGE